MSSEPGLVLKHIDLPLQPGARITIRHSPGWTEFSPFPGLSPDPLGYTISVNGKLWRATFVCSSIGPDGAFLTLEIEGRYGQGQVSQA
jgi:hypothetical protein